MGLQQRRANLELKFQLSREEADTLKQLHDFIERVRQQDESTPYHGSDLESCRVEIAAMRPPIY